MTANALKTQLNLPSPMHRVSWPTEQAKLQQLQIFVKRDDLIHSEISGNKWRKLAPVIAQIQDRGLQRVISFGGGYSNHLHALAFVCKQLGVQLIAMVRGDYSNNLTPTLKDMLSWGAKLVFVSKLEYKQRVDNKYCEQLLATHHGDLIIPEGGSGTNAINGLAPLWAECSAQIDTPHYLNTPHYIIAPVASGGTLAGIVAGVSSADHSTIKTALPRTEVIGIGVLKGRGYLEDLINDLLGSSALQTSSDLSSNLSSTDVSLAKWHIEHDFHHGGYAKSSNELITFIEHFEQQTQIPLEPVYSGKCFYALNELINNNYFAPNSRIVILHTGGLQGKRH